MKTRIMMMGTLLLLSLNLAAQTLRVGIMGGMSSEAIKIDQVPNSLTNMIKGTGIVGGEAGLFLKLKVIDIIYVKPEFLLHYANGTVVADYSDGANSDVTFSYFKAEIPVMFGVNLIGPLSIQAGPVYNYNIATTKNFNGERVNATPGGLGYRFGAGIDLGKSAIFDLCLQGQGNSASATQAAFHVPYSIVADLGIMFGGGK